jgi:hypothetical protein
VRSSPRMNTASHSSISRRVGVRMGPRRRISIMSNHIGFGIGHAAMEVVWTHESAQSEVGFE